jgi:ATP-dependent Clp protease ATP-binding subunit ClpC
MNNRRFSPKVKEVIKRSREEAFRLGHDFIGTEHLLLGIVSETDSLAVRVLESLDVELSDLKQTLEESVQKIPANNTNLSVGTLPLNKQAEKVLKVTFLEAKMLKSEEISSTRTILPRGSFCILKWSMKSTRQS